MGNIFNIQRFCTSDGPGIRTTVFFKGCPLKCLWCHNPESQKSSTELMFDKEKCTGCEKCAPRCTQNCHIFKNRTHIFDRESCIACGKCISPLCDALALSGKDMSADEILNEVLKDKVFYRTSGGGLTLSGGEPLIQSDFCVEILRAAKEKELHTCIETCGHVPSEAILQSAKYTDLYLFDLKESDSHLHLKFTGADNKLILENLMLLNKLGKDIILRCPLIPDFNCREEHIIAISDIANSLHHVIGIEIEPYHEFGVSKYEKLGRAYYISPNSIDNTYYGKYVDMLKDRTEKPVKNIK